MAQQRGRGVDERERKMVAKVRRDKVDSRGEGREKGRKAQHLWKCLKRKNQCNRGSSAEERRSQQKEQFNVRRPVTAACPSASVMHKLSRLQIYIYTYYVGLLHRKLGLNKADQIQVHQDEDLWEKHVYFSFYISAQHEVKYCFHKTNSRATYSRHQSLQRTLVWRMQVLLLKLELQEQQRLVVMKWSPKHQNPSPGGCSAPEPRPESGPGQRWEQAWGRSGLRDITPTAQTIG